MCIHDYAGPPHPQIADVLSVIAGTMSMIAQVALYGWLEESAFVKGALSGVVAIGVFFLAYLVRLLLRD